MPLPAPGVIKQALKWMLKEDSPLLIRPRLDFGLVNWLLQFARNCRVEPMMRGIPILRDLCRAAWVKKEWHEQAGETVGVLVLVYDHDTRALADKLADIQHDRHEMITSALHVHLDRHTCLEVIPLRGAAHAIERLANDLLSVKGVRYGQLVPATTGKTLT